MKSQETENSTFVHAGKVSRITNDTVFVSLDDNIHCESCRAKAACGISESKNKEIEILDPGQRFEINENVNVVLKKALGLKAVFWAYVFPFILVISVLIIASQLMLEWQAGLIALFSLVPYYGLLHLLNSFFRKKLKVSVLKLV